VREGDFLLLLGTTKGAFILRSNAQRSRWEVGGPYFHGHNVCAMAFDGRAGQHRIWASTQNYWGTLLRSSDDFGKSWTNPQQAPIRFPSETGVSLKNIWQITLGRPEEPNVLYCGVEPAALFETRVPSDFGFAVVMHPRNPDCVYIVPVESDEFRCACDGRLRVYRTRNGGASWEPLMRGLPQKRAYETVLRDGTAADSFDPVGIYFGTRSGQLFGSRDEGKTWGKILEGLPSVVCVRTAVVEDSSDGLVPTLPKAAPAPSSSHQKTKCQSKSKARGTKSKR
jgi:hypothetical protein